MFKINNNRNILSDLPIITDNYEVLHFDEFPILFIGLNRYGNKILGSLVCEDEEDDNLFRYFQSIVTNEVHSKFINKKISYLEALKSSTSIFVLDKNINDKILAVFHVSYEEIPEDYLPLANSFCPAIALKSELTSSNSITEEESTGVLEQDKTDKEYKISIYHLNTDTRIGNAYIPNDKDDDFMDKPKITILEDTDLIGSIYTESLHLSKWIKIIGRAKKINGRFREIQIKRTA